MNGVYAGVTSAVIGGTCIGIARHAAGRCGCRIDAGRRSQILLGSAVALGILGCALSRATVGEVTTLSVAGVCTATDLECGYIFDYVVAFGCLVTLSCFLLQGGAVNAAIGAASGASVPALLNIVSRGRGLALGDVKLAALLGMAESASGALFMVAVAFITGGAVATILVITRRKGLSDALPFAPFLSMGAWFVLLAMGR